MNEDESISAPNRDDVADQWLKMMRHEITREEVHAWSKPWVEHRSGEISDPLVRLGLMRLHGFDMVYVGPGTSVVRHGGPGPYAHSENAIAEAFNQWKAKCAQPPR